MKSQENLTISWSKLFADTSSQTFCLALFLSLLFVLQPLSGKAQTPLRVGHFPNITHAQGVIAHAMSDKGEGWFEKKLSVPVEWYVYNAGPSAMEALLAGSIDLAYVGPNPAINAYVKSKGQSLRVVSGAAKGGSALVVRQGEGFDSAEKLRGKKIATPQFGNTQDVSARAWFISHGLTITQMGGDAFLIPTANPDQLTLFQRKEIDAVWTVEPWVSRLELEAQGTILVNEENAITTVLVVSSRALKERPELIRAFVKAHGELTDWINHAPVQAKELLNQGLKAQTSRAMPPELIDHSWNRLTFSTTVNAAEFQDFLARAQQVGFLKEASDISSLVEVLQ